MDVTTHYRNLLQLGREAFLAAAAPGALVRYRGSADDLGDLGATTLTLEQAQAATAEERAPHRPEGPGTGTGTDPSQLEIFPLIKKPGASFPDRITIGRTPNNDVVIADPSVSRLHAYVRQERGAWRVADAGSKNGSWLASAALAPRQERTLASKAILRLGDVDLTFYLAADLFAALGGR